MVISVGKETLRAFRRILGDRVNKTSEVDQEAEVKAPVSSGQWTPWAADNGSEHRQGLCAGRGRLALLGHAELESGRETVEC